MFIFVIWNLWFEDCSLLLLFCFLTGRLFSSRLVQSNEQSCSRVNTLPVSQARNSHYSKKIMKKENLVQITERAKEKRNVPVVDLYSDLEFLLIFPVTASTLLYWFKLLQVLQKQPQLPENHVAISSAWQELQNCVVYLQRIRYILHNFSDST